MCSSSAIRPIGYCGWSAARCGSKTHTAQPPSIPFWLGEAPGRQRRAVDGGVPAESRRRRTPGRSPAAGLTAPGSAKLAAARGGVHGVGWVAETFGIDEVATSQLIQYLAAGRAALGCLPTLDTIVFERFFDESGGMQLVIHSPFGSRVNRAWGLACASGSAGLSILSCRPRRRKITSSCRSRMRIASSWRKSRGI